MNDRLSLNFIGMIFAVIEAILDCIMFAVVYLPFAVIKMVFTGRSPRNRR